jgi:hypothetical protein
VLPTINPTPWSDWAIIAGVVLTPLGIFHRRIRAWFRKNRDGKKFMDGVRGVRGVMEAIPGAPERLTNVETKLTTIDSKVDKMASTLSVIAAHIGNVQTDVRVLVADTKTNGGTTSRDQLNRIEDAVGSNPPEKE